MALLASCWVFVEIFILPNGFVKWFILSRYINPFFLIFCQIFLWQKEFQKFICYLFGICCFISSLIIIYIKRAVVFVLASLSTPAKLEVFYEVMDHNIQSINGAVIVKSTFMSISKPKTGDSKVSSWHDSSLKVEEKDELEEFKNSWLNEYLTSNHYNSAPFSNEPDMNSYQSQSSSLNSSSIEMDQEFHCNMESFDDEAIVIPQSLEGITSKSEDIVNNTTDLLPQSAEIQQFVEGIHPTSSTSPARSMKSINDLILSDKLSSSCINEEFTRGIEDFEINSLPKDAEVDYEYLLAISRFDIVSFEQSLVSISFHNMYAQRMRFFDVLYQERLYGINAIGDADLASPSSMTSIASQNSMEVQKKKLLKSLKSDLELVYTAEACLTWEALHYQYRKVETLARCDMSQRCRQFCTNVSENFRKFQISFERFMEDQKLSEVASNPSHTNNRRCQLRVPDVTEYMEDDNCDLRRGEALEAVEKCIKSFWTYVKTNCKKSSWKLKVILWPNPTVEDPKDLQLLYDLTKALQKKEQVVKDLQKKKKQSLLKRRVKPVQAECGSIDVLCCAVDLKLVEKVLKMPVISTIHLKWCQEKLNNIELRDGQLCRGTGAYLFPFS